MVIIMIDIAHLDKISVGDVVKNVHTREYHKITGIEYVKTYNPITRKKDGKIKIYIIGSKGRWNITHFIENWELDNTAVQVCPDNDFMYGISYEVS
jgi:hypothetical protein